MSLANTINEVSRGVQRNFQNSAENNLRMAGLQNQLAEQRVREPLLRQELREAKQAERPFNVQSILPNHPVEAEHFVSNVLPSVGQALAGDGFKIVEGKYIQKPDGTMLQDWEANDFIQDNNLIRYTALNMLPRKTFETRMLKNQEMLESGNLDPQQAEQLQAQNQQMQGVLNDPSKMYQINKEHLANSMATLSALERRGYPTDFAKNMILPLQTDIANYENELGRQQNLEDKKSIIDYKADRNPPSERSPYITPVQTSTGILGFDTRTGQVSQVYDNDGNPVLPISADVSLAGKKKTAEKTAEAEVGKKYDFPKARSRFTNLNTKWDRIIGTKDQIGIIDEAIKMVNPFTAGVGAWSKIIPASPAKNLAAKLDTIRANVGFDKLSEMRADSPTGGALGQVSEFENKLLQSVLGSLEQDQSPAQLRDNLMKVKQAMESAKNNLDRAYNLDYKQYINGEMVESEGVDNQSIGEQKATAAKQVVRTGTHNGRKVIQYDNGDIEYAD